MKEIKSFLENKENLKNIIQITKQTDAIYLEKRNIPKEYNPEAHYDFKTWKEQLSDEIKVSYGDLHNTLLYTNQKQDWSKVEKVFSHIDQIMREIGE
jgi:hypothetical protein